MDKNKLLPLFLLGCMPTMLYAQKQPNVILFLVDDMGWQDTSVPFHTERTSWNDTYHTPSMERLAEKGIKFTQAYASAVSSPTRVSLMTGMNPVTHRVTNWTLRRNLSQDQKSDLLNFPSWNMNGLQPVGSNIPNSVEANTLPQLLQEAGYFTIHCGKAHFGAMETPGENPLNLGFNVNIAGHAAGGPASYLGEANFGYSDDPSKTSPFAIPGLKKYWGKDIFATEALTIEALASVDSLRKADVNRPFFLYMAHYAIHVPLNIDKRFYQKYRDAGLDHSQAMYASLIEGMDKSLGDIMQYLDDNQLTDNTVIIFMSDNGGLSACGRSGVKDSHNSPLRGGKGSSYEGGTRVPMIVFDPRIKRCQAVEQTPVDITDFMPTILSMVGVENYKTVQKIEGQNITPLLAGKRMPELEERNFVWHYPNRWDCHGAGIGTFSSIRRGDYKLIYFYDTGLSELYNIKHDLSEKRNLALEPEFEPIRKKLAAELTNYIISRAGQLPTVKATGEQCNYPN